jgi:hypothetical protein
MNRGEAISKDGTTLYLYGISSGAVLALRAAAHAARMPTLVMDGGEREGEEFFHEATQALVQALPNPQYRVLIGQPHGPVDPEVLAPVLAEFFADKTVHARKAQVNILKPEGWWSRRPAKCPEVLFQPPLPEPCMQVSRHMAL